jgi:hypothetical protein
MKLLEEHKQEQDELKKTLGNKWKNTNKVLIDDFGGLMNPDTPSKIFYKLQTNEVYLILNFIR